jgi:WD40-like Beta Propeller Repeat
VRRWLRLPSERFRITLPLVLRSAPLLALAAVLAACSSAEPAPKEPLGYLPSAVTTATPEWIPFSVRAGKSVPNDPRERHLTDLRQLTFGQGENAEGYFSPDGKRLIFQSTRDGAACHSSTAASLVFRRSNAAELLRQLVRKLLRQILSKAKIHLILDV